MKFKRLLASFFAATMCFSMLPAVVSADEVALANDVAIVEEAEQQSVIKVAKDTATSPNASPNASPSIDQGTTGKLSWKLTGSGVLLISGKGSMPNYGYGKAPWSKYTSDIKTVKIASTVTSIGNYAFAKCTALSSISIPSGIKTIGTCAFYKSSIKKVSGGSKVTKIGKSAFSGCSKLSSFSISSKYLKSIGSYAFKGTKVKTLSIKYTKKLTKKGVKKSLKKSKIKKVNVKNSKRFLYSYYFAKFNSGKKVKVY
ncbi:MAG: leucine-rich repeat domain-containing protein [Saccharofermentans sp.]|nr:leucine-rich repeat domain-containing protein [Saccharofermentans sp.]